MDYDGSLEGLFAILEGVCNWAEAPAKIYRRDACLINGDNPSQVGLFDREPPPPREYPGTYNDTKKLDGIAGTLYEVSAAGYSNFVYAWMSELPVEAEIIAFAYKIIRAAGNAGGTGSLAGREAAEIARNDRMDPAVKTVRDAAYKAGFEAHRLMGLLRFSTGEANVPVAFCSPDHFILPALAEHFTLRFGDSPWAIVDEKRGLALIRQSFAGAELELYNPGHHWFRALQKSGHDNWEKLWQSYFKVINNESRANPKLQLRFMPRRYWKYLPETVHQAE